ncbi:MAG: ferrous iron transport protein B, partial [bacterium]
ERNLLLTLQLCDQELPLVVLLHMFDEVRRRNIVIDPRKLSHYLGVPVVPTVGTKGEGIAQLIEILEALASKETLPISPFKVEFDPSVEEALENIQQLCLEEGYAISRGYAIGLLTGEPSAGRHFPPSLLSAIRELVHRKKPHLGNSWADEITHYRYSAISRLMGLVASPYPNDEDTFTHRLDSVFIHPYWGIPIFLVVLFILFQLTFSLGAIPMGWIDQGMSQLSRWVVRLVPGIWGQIIGEGVIGGAGMILVFLPNIIILMMGIHLLEDSGYMARAAFLMDRMMRLMRLHGKAFIPLLMGFGCNVPALLATRTLESHRDRLLTMLITPFMSCSARLPVYVMITAALFPRSGGLIIFGLYLLGIVVAIIMGRLLSRTLLKGQSVPFVLELPPYRWPTLKTTYRLLKFSTWLFIKRIGTLVACSAVFIWFLTYFPPSSSPFGKTEAPLVGYRENSYIYYLGRAIEPIF